MYKFLLVFVCALLLAGCAIAPKIFSHSSGSKNNADLQSDLYDCNKDAYARINSMGLAVNPMMRGTIEDLVVVCMENKYGWKVEKQ